MNEVEKVRLAAHALADSLTSDSDMDEFARRLHDLAMGDDAEDATALAATFLLGLVALMLEQDEDRPASPAVVLIRQVIIKSTIDKVFLPGGPQAFSAQN